jgi:adenine-specific DNA-methyltransferase
MPPRERLPVRPIQYLGSKVRLLDAIGAAIDRVDPAGGPAIDLFAGSGVVAARLAERRPVTAVDIQEYSRVLCSALLTPKRLSPADAAELSELARRRERKRAGGSLACLIEHEAVSLSAAAGGEYEPLAEVLEAGSMLAFERGEGPAPGALADALHAAARAASVGVITRYYGGVYFSYRQALQLDCLADCVRSIDPRDRDVALAAVLAAASEAVSSVGSQFAQPVRPRDAAGKPKGGLLKAVVRKRRLDVIDAFGRWAWRLADGGGVRYASTAVRADYREFLRSRSEPVSVIYADPPYTRDHYSRFYHVLETLALGDAPSVSTTNLNGGTRLSRGLYRGQRHQSPFCIRSQAGDAFTELFAGARQLQAPLVLSYSPYTENSSERPRVLSVARVVELARESYPNVEVESVGELAHSKLNAAHRNTSVLHDAEVLVVCRV